MKSVANLLFGKAPTAAEFRSLNQRAAELEAKCEKLSQERDALASAKQEADGRRHMDRIIHHSPWRMAGEPGIARHTAGAHGSRALAERVAAAYKKAVLTPVGSSESMWLNEFAAVNADTHQVLLHGDIDAVAALLGNPASSMLFYGFDNLQSKSTPTMEPETWWLHWNQQLAYDGLLQLARALGARRLENPEANIDFSDAPDVEALLQQIDDRLGIRIDFPNLYDGELGLQTSRGVANIRAVYALYQAWRTVLLVADRRQARVLEIGAGLGRAAYYTLKLGIRDYTIIDIPLTGVSQGYYLGSLLGELAVSLWGEAGAPVRVLPPVAYETMDESFDLIVNVDSLTEMAKPTAESYLRGATRLAPKFFSVNHEHNAFTVESIYRDMPGVTAWRSPCWARRGYVEEVISFGASDKS